MKNALFSLVLATSAFAMSNAHAGLWVCDTWSNRGYDYKYQGADRDTALQGAESTCSQYEEQNGLGFCYYDQSSCVYDSSLSG